MLAGSPGRVWRYPSSISADRRAVNRSPTRYTAGITPSPGGGHAVTPPRPARHERALRPASDPGRQRTEVSTVVEGGLHDREAARGRPAEARVHHLRREFQHPAV